MFAARDNKLFLMNVYHCVSAERIQRFLQPVTSDLIEGVVDEHAAGMKISQADRDFISGFFAHALDDYPRGRYGPEAVRFRCRLSWRRYCGAPLCAEPFLFGGRCGNAGDAPERRVATLHIARHVQRVPHGRSPRFASASAGCHVLHDAVRVDHGGGQRKRDVMRAERGRERQPLLPHRNCERPLVQYLTLTDTITA